MAEDERVPPGVDANTPSIARVYDYMLGGKDNFAVDRHVGDLALQITPDAPEAGKAGRAFLSRAIRHLVSREGVRQFLDIGSGLPTQGNVHEIAQALDPTVRVVYVDNDPMVLAHSRALLTGGDTTMVLRADIREPGSILGSPEVVRFLDFDRPIGLLLMSILHHLHDDEDPGGIAAQLRAALPSGSFLAIVHFHNPGERLPEIAAEALAGEKLFNEHLGTGRWRRHEEILSYFGDFELLEPGLVPLSEWRPNDGPVPAQTHTYHTMVGGVARKP